SLRSEPLLRPRAAPAGHKAIGDARLGEIVRRQLTEHLVAHEHADTVLAHAPGGVTQDFMTILELDPEHRVRQQFHHLAAHFEEFFFGHAVSVSLCPELRAHSGGRKKREGPRSCGSDSPDTSVTLYYPSRLAWLVQCSKDAMGLVEFVWGIILRSLPATS